MAGPLPTDHDRLVAMREHADRSMREYATARLASGDDGGIDASIRAAYMALVANFIALMEGPALDDRSMMAGRDRIIQRYLEQAKTDPTHPGVCSFCGERPVVAWFEGPTFKHAVLSPYEVRSDEAMLACATCRDLIEAGDHDEIAKRSAARTSRGSFPADKVRRERERQEREFWDPRSEGQ